MGDHLLTVELSGYINYLDKENPSQPKKVLKVGTQLHIHLSFFTKRGAYLEYCIKNVNVPLFVLGLNICTWPFLETSVRHLISWGSSHTFGIHEVPSSWEKSFSHEERFFWVEKKKPGLRALDMPIDGTNNICD